ncbi:MAG: formylglycine-generating enzyme family protein [Pseudomonadota bacterium]|nr:formylglycine-generating enzyme family protein [Pseudomonadota bacterium]
MQRLDPIIRALSAAGLDPTPEDLLDVIWLAARIAATAEAVVETQPPSGPERPASEERQDEAAPRTPAAEPIEEPQKPTEAREQEARLHRYHRPSKLPRIRETADHRASPFRVPAVPPLPQALALARALRPLRRRIASRVERILDEDSTVERIADQDIWAPVFQPKPEPWLELALVVDAADSMVVWEPAITALQALLQRLGAFRTQRTWRLQYDRSKGGTSVRLIDETQARARPDPFSGTSGAHRVILVLSDCVAHYWGGDRALYEVLDRWGSRYPMALVQMLPQRMWSASALAETPVINLSAAEPGRANYRLTCLEGSLPSGALKLPVLTLDPHDFGTWAALITGRAETWCTGLAFRARRAQAATVDADRQQRPDDRLIAFRSLASPEARRLAQLFSVLPLTLPVMRLAQQVLLPESRLTHLAEVFLGGLLRRVDQEDRPSGAPEADPLKIPFDFHDEIRETLLEDLPNSEVEWVNASMAAAVEHRLGQVGDFLALLADPGAEGRYRLDSRSLPFARVRLKVLRRLGGTYSELADRLSGDIGEIEQDLADRLSGEIERELGPGPKRFRDPFIDGSALGPAMIWLPGGTFRMGDGQGIGQVRERPVHEVTLSQFGAGKYPLTVGEFRRFVEATGYKTEAERGGGAWVWNRGEAAEREDASWRKPYMEQDDSHPVVCISWNDANAYCEWLSKETGQAYGLLTEAQWEYACRGGRESAYCFGDDEKDLESYAWFGDSSASGSTHAVGKKNPNAWQLHDMHGNVWEWCRDWFSEDYYQQLANSAVASARDTAVDASSTASSASRDPSGPESGSSRVVRGGSWLAVAGRCRSAYRVRNDPGRRYSNLGFRLSRTGPPHSYPFTRGPAQYEGPPPPGICDRLRDGTKGPPMVWLPGGSFVMGQDDSSYGDEKPAHAVQVCCLSL